MKKFLVDEWSAIRTWWSVWAGTFSVIVLTVVPVINEHWPDLAPTFVSVFPKHGQQWAPIVGVGLAMLARLLDQAAVLDGFRRVFHHFRKGGGDGADQPK